MKFATALEKKIQERKDKKEQEKIDAANLQKNNCAAIVQWLTKNGFKDISPAPEHHFITCKLNENTTPLGIHVHNTQFMGSVQFWSHNRSDTYQFATIEYLPTAIEKLFGF